jgi:hypothetical protein
MDRKCRMQRMYDKYSQNCCRTMTIGKILTYVGGRYRNETYRKKMEQFGLDSSGSG